MSSDIIQSLKKQKTFVMIKPDGVSRGLVGQILSRIENKQLKIVAMKMLQATKDQIKDHYPSQDNTRITRLGKKGIATFTENNLDPKEYLGTDDEFEIGQKVLENLINYMTRGPMVIMVVQGVNAIQMMRKIMGSTIPANSELGTVRGDFSIDTAFLSSIEGRPMYNLMHASETPQEAEHEISLRFDKHEISDI